MDEETLLEARIVSTTASVDFIREQMELTNQRFTQTEKLSQRGNLPIETFYIEDLVPFGHHGFAAVFSRGKDSLVANLWVEDDHVTATHGFLTKRFAGNAANLLAWRGESSLLYADGPTVRSYNWEEGRSELLFDGRQQYQEEDFMVFDRTRTPESCRRVGVTEEGIIYAFGRVHAYPILLNGEVGAPVTLEAAQRNLIQRKYTLETLPLPRISDDTEQQFPFTRADDLRQLRYTESALSGGRILSIQDGSTLEHPAGHYFGTARFSVHIPNLVSVSTTVESLR